MTTGSRTAASRRRSEERRLPDRPRNGETKPCPTCAGGRLIFSEQYRVIEETGATPAWICDSPPCGLRLFTRSAQAIPERRRAESFAVGASARRQTMKARALRDRSQDVLAEGRARLASSSPVQLAALEGDLLALAELVAELQRQAACLLVENENWREVVRKESQRLDAFFAFVADRNAR